MTDLRVDVAVVGAGLMGAATAAELTRRGSSVVLLEAREPGHRLGSSHGSSRIFRRAYADAFYVRLTGAAGELWREAELEAGVTLLRTIGGLDHGVDRDPAGLATTLAEAGVPVELLGAAEAAERWPGMRFDGPVLFHPEAGVLDPEAAVAAWVRLATERGGTFLARTPVRRVDVESGGALVHTDDGVVHAATVVLSVGAWLPELADRLGLPVPLPELTVTQQQVFHFRQLSPETPWPVFVHKAALQVFGLPSDADGGPGPTFKVAQHDGGTPTTASTRSGVIPAAARDRMRDHVRHWLPGLDPEPVAEQSCLYTMTPDEDFVLDRVGPIVVVSPCSGHGAKFAPLVGQLAADLALGIGQPEPRFALGR